MTLFSDQPKWLWPAVLLICLWGLWARVDYYQRRDWWIDEVNQYNNTVGPLKPFWTRANYHELYSFPGDYLLTYPFVNAFQTNKWGVAVPHFIITVSGFYFLALLCRRYLKHPASWLLTFLVFAGSAELILHALELRPYSVLAVMGLAVFYYLENLLDPGVTVRRQDYLFYFLFFIFCIGYHPYGLAIIAFCGFYFLLKYYRATGFWPKVKQILPLWLLICAVGVPLWLYYSASPHAIRADNPDRRMVFEFIANPLTDPVGFLKGVIGNLTGSKLFYVLLAGTLVRLFYPQEGRREILAIFLCLYAVPILVILYSDALYGYWFLQRQFVWLTALFPLFLGLCWDGIFGALTKKSKT